MRSASNRAKISFAIVCGILVGTITACTHWLILSHDQTLLTHAFLGDLIGGLSTVIVCLAMGLGQERASFIHTLYSVSIVSKLNHQLQTSVFPLRLVVQKASDEETCRLAEQAVERINDALREATADAISRRTGHIPKT